MWLEVLSGEDAGRVLEVDRALVLGRVRGADLVIRDARASRRHAELVPDDGALRLRDLGSANGTLVDGAPAREAKLRGGEEIRIGGVRIAVLAQEPAVTGAPVAKPVRRRPQVDTEGPSWSMIGRLVDARTRRGRRLTYAALAVAALAVAGVVALALSGALAGKSDEQRVADVVRSVAPATVRIETRFGGHRSGLGSGWVLDRRAGLVVTAAHVVNTGELFFVSSDAGESEAKVVGVDACEDLAVLHVTGGLGGAALPIGDAEAARQGETVLAFGFPATAAAGEPASSTRGVVSAASTAFRDPAADVPAYAHAIRTDTALDPGFSGGPLVDLDGRLVGINAAVRTSAGGQVLQGANYAVSAEHARAVLQSLRSGRSAGWIGAGFGYPSTRDLAERPLPPGLWVQSVVAGSGADRAGLRDGDYVVAVDGRPLDGTLSGWCRAAGRLHSGQSAKLELSPPGSPSRTVDVRVG
jgi:S1-C subfamily serine protease